MRTVFTSTSAYDGYPGHRDRSGQEVEIVREALGKDGPDEETMYIIRFDDGKYGVVFADELAEVPA